MCKWIRTNALARDVNGEVTQVMMSQTKLSEMNFVGMEHVVEIFWREGTREILSDSMNTKDYIVVKVPGTMPWGKGDKGGLLFMPKPVLDDKDSAKRKERVKKMSDEEELQIENWLKPKQATEQFSTLYEKMLEVKI